MQSSAPSLHSPDKDKRQRLDSNPEILQVWPEHQAASHGLGEHTRQCVHQVSSCVVILLSSFQRWKLGDGVQHLTSLRKSQFLVPGKEPSAKCKLVLP